MRLSFAKTLLTLAKQDKRLLLLTADLGFHVWDDFSATLPQQFFNVGVAEQNMMGVATGLAKAGFIPFTYSIVTFATLRPYEFIRNGALLHELPVRVVGVGGGYEYGTLGHTHHGLEDIGVMRVQPDMMIVAPADSQQAATALRATYDYKGPIYYRLGKNDNAIIPGLEGRFELGKVDVLREGADLLWITLGPITAEVLSAADALLAQGIKSSVLLVSSINPSPREDILAYAAKFSKIITVESHYTIGGLGSLVSEIVTDAGLGCRVLRLGVSKALKGISGSEKFYNAQYGLDAASLIAQAQRDS